MSQEATQQATAAKKLGRQPTGQPMSQTARLAGMQAASQTVAREGAMAELWCQGADLYILPASPVPMTFGTREED